MDKAASASILLSVLFSFSAAKAQSFVWAKRLGGVSADHAHHVALDSSGNVYTTGTFVGTVDFDPGPGTFNLTSAGTDAFVSKLDASGAFVWATRVGGAAASVSPYGVSIREADGALFVAGRFHGTVDFGDGPLTARGDYDAFLLEVTPTGSPAGAMQWGLSSLGVDHGTAVASFENNVYWIGSINLGPATLSHDGFIRAGLTGFGQGLLYDGTFSAAPNSWVEPYAIALDAVGNAYIAGFIRGTADLDPHPEQSLSFTSASGSEDVFVLKLNVTGDLVWARLIGNAGDDRALALAVDPDGDLIIGGGFEGTVDFDPAPLSTSFLTSTDNARTFVLKWDAAGNHIWAKAMGGLSRPFPEKWTLGVGVDGTGHVHVAGNFLGTADFDPGIGVFNLTSAGSDDAFVAKLDGFGNFVQASRLGGASADRAFSLAVELDGEVVAIGSFVGTADFDPGPATFNLVSAGSYDSFITKLRPTGAGEVPDNGFVPGVPLTIGKTLGGVLALQWGTSCGPSDEDYGVYEGSLGTFASHVPVLCSTGGMTNASISPSVGNRYYLVVASTGTFEGFYGKDSSGVERLPSTQACLPQQSIGMCP